MIQDARQICANLNVAILALLNQTEDPEALLSIAEANTQAALSMIQGEMARIEKAKDKAAAEWPSSSRLPSSYRAWR